MAEGTSGKAAPHAGFPLGKQPGFEDVAGALQGILLTHEVQVLSIMGLLIGYICVFFAKILGFTNIYTGMLGISVLTLLLMLLDKNFDWRDFRYWIRSAVVVSICLLVTAPQLYYAWTVSVDEVHTAVIKKLQIEAEEKAQQQVAPHINIK